MVWAASRIPDFDLDAVNDLDARESGTRRVARKLTPAPEETPSRQSQRPTLPVPSAEHFFGYLEATPAISDRAPPIALAPTPPPEALEPKPALLAEKRMAIQMRAVEPKPEASKAEPSTVVPPRDIPREDTPVPRGGTLRLRLTPYAREHAAADLGTDDTPGAMLDYLKSLGSLEHVPHLKVTMREILGAKLNHKEGFVLSLIDGKSDIDALVDASPMPTHKLLRILLALRERGLIDVRAPRG